MGKNNLGCAVHSTRFLMNERVENMDEELHIPKDRFDGRARSVHDIKASLAISNGFSQALETALSELRQSYLAIVQSVDADVPPECLQQLRQHENDCKFCLSRLSSSLQQLKTRIDESPLLSPSEEDKPREDAA